MNFNLPCFIPQYPIAQTPFVYVPFFQSYPTYNYYVPMSPVQNFVLQPESTPQSIMNTLPQESQLQQEQVHFSAQENDNQNYSSSLAKTDEKVINDESNKQIPNKNQSKSNLKNNVQFEKESKNIQKNYAKAIASFVSKNKQLASKLLTSSEVDEFIQLTKSIKNQIQNVCHISQYTNNQDYIKAFRILGNYFLKTKSNSYIFNSRIQKKNSHLRSKKLIHHSLLRC